MTSTNAFNFDGHIALVTGGTSGIGKAIVQKLAESRAKVIVNSESESACNELVEQLASRGYQPIAMPADLSKKNATKELATKIKTELPKLDMVFLNAGITGNVAAESGDYDAQSDLVFDINIHAPRILCDLLLPFMAEKGKGAAVLTSSLSGLRGNKHIGTYSLTKAAVAQLARDMAVKFGPDGVRVNAISPGLIATGWEKHILSNPDAAEHRMRMTPLRRIGQPEEIANAALFLASDLASFITGHNLVADGGTLITDGN